MKTITQFKVTKDQDTYIAESVDLAIVTQAQSLDILMANIKEAVSLYFENEKLSDLDFSNQPKILINYELSQYA